MEAFLCTPILSGLMCMLVVLGLMCTLVLLGLMCTLVLPSGTSNIVFERNVPKLDGPHVPAIDPTMEGPRLPNTDVPACGVAKVGDLERPKLEGPVFVVPLVEEPRFPNMEVPDVSKAMPRGEVPRGEVPRGEAPIGEVPKEVGARRCWEEGHVDELLKQYEMQTATCTAPMDLASGTKIIFSHGGLVEEETKAPPPVHETTLSVNATTEVSAICCGECCGESNL